MDAFEKAYQNLNLEQKRAVDAIEGPVMVVAGPGTGKTQMLTLRIANILKQTDTAPDSILALTFTESGVISMRSRLASIVGSESSKVSIHTFHGFCRSIIEHYPEAFPEIIGAKQMDDTTRLLLIREALESTDAHLLRPLGDPLYHLQSISSGIQDAKREYVSPDALTKWAKQKLQETNEDPDAVHTKGAHKGKMKGAYLDQIKKYEKHIEFSDVYAKYEALRKSRHLYDYEDMIIEVVRALEGNPDFLLTLQEKYQYLLADEHQDANNAQNRLLNLLASYHDNPNIFVVGDPDQAIYRFQGASVANFLSFKEEYPSTLLVTLKNNYRSAQELLNAMAPLSLGNIVGEGEGTLIASREKTKGKLSVLSAPDTLSEYGGLADAIQSDIASGEVPEEIAILVRKNRDAKGVGAVLRKKNIPFHIVSGSSFFDEPLIRDFLRLIRSLAFYGEEGFLAEVLSSPYFSIDPLDLYKILATRRKTREPLYQLLSNKISLEATRVGDVQKILTLGKKLKEWKESERKIGLLQAIEKIAHESGFVTCIMHSIDSIEKLEAYRVVFEYTANFNIEYPDATFAQLIERFDLMQEYRLKGTKTAIIPPGKVRILTVHSAKGLEWNSVYLVGVTENNWEGMRERSNFSGVFEISGLIPEPDAHVLDERRLFYVALSRARKRLTISKSRISESGRELLPSVFLQEMERKNLKEIDISSDVGQLVLSTPPRSENDSGEIGAYLRALFLEQGLTPTALNNYLKDPWEYFFQNLLRIPASPKPHQLFGTAVHAALEQFFMESKTQGTFFGKKELLAFFASAVEREPFSPRDLAEAKRRGEKELASYFDFIKPRFDSINLETLRGEYPLAGVVAFSDIELPLSGKVDRLEDMDGRLRVIDYKTGEYKTRNDIEGKTKSSDGAYKRQLVFYTFLLSLEGKKLDEAVLEFIKPDSKGMHHLEAFVITDMEVAELKETIERVSTEILSLAFWNMEPLPDNPYMDLVMAFKEKGK